MNIKILFDNNSAKKNILKGWGFSCLVDNSILFDTGENGESLLHNMKEMGVDVSCVKDVVISHDHWDHTGGLNSILERKKGIKVYACPGFSPEFKKNVKDLQGDLVVIGSFAEVRKDIFATGAIVGRHKSGDIEEQVLVVKTSGGIMVITGCAHPGIVEIVEKVKKKFPNEKLSCVLGGFHLLRKQKNEIVDVAERLKKLGVGK